MIDSAVYEREAAVVVVVALALACRRLTLIFLSKRQPFLEFNFLWVITRVLSASIGWKGCFLCTNGIKMNRHLLLTSFC